MLNPKGIHISAHLPLPLPLPLRLPLHFAICSLHWNHYLPLSKVIPGYFR